MTPPSPDPLDAVAWPVRTPRLLLRRAAPEDTPATWEVRRHPAVAAWITSAPATFEEYAAYASEPTYRDCMLVVERDGRIVGDLMLRVGDAWAQSEVKERARGVEAELGWCLHPDQHGHGLATEAVDALLRICFEQLGLRRVTAACFAANEPSWRLMERLGMRREAHTVRDSLHRSGEWHDGYCYALLAEEHRPAVT
jgi:RimJ/RimL family protein N-acetyltransferase